MERIDKFLGKWASRKLLVFIVATILAFIGKLDSSDWTYIGIAYITIQGMVDASILIKEYFKK